MQSPKLAHHTSKVTCFLTFARFHRQPSAQLDATAYSRSADWNRGCAREEVLTEFGEEEGEDEPDGASSDDQDRQMRRVASASPTG